MKNQKTHSVQQLGKYLKSVSYHLTYRQDDFDAYYNPRNRQYILLPFAPEKRLSKQDIIDIFTESMATDLPPELEYSRFTLYLHSISNT